MTYLLDVNVLIAAIWREHQDQRTVESWLRGKKTATCPLSELGFLRISSGDTFPLRAEPQLCRKALSEFLRVHRCRFISDDFSPQEIAASSSRQFTDLYLAELADKHGMKVATLDTGISHQAVEVVIS
jgi:predicted nucleic acid-binding protein